MTHKYIVGQMVNLEHRSLRAAAPGAYQIRHLMPLSDNSADEPRYRIKSVAEKHDRVIPECDLFLSNGSASAFS